MFVVVWLVLKKTNPENIKFLMLDGDANGVHRLIGLKRYAPGIEQPVMIRIKYDLIIIT